MLAISFKRNVTVAVGLTTCFPSRVEAFARFIPVLPSKRSYLPPSLLCYHQHCPTMDLGIGNRAHVIFPLHRRLFSSVAGSTCSLHLLATPVPSTSQPLPGTCTPATNTGIV